MMCLLNILFPNLGCSMLHCHRNSCVNTEGKRECHFAGAPGEGCHLGVLSCTSQAGASGVQQQQKHRWGACHKWISAQVIELMTHY